MAKSAKADLWMPLYIGDYLRDTMHLTTLEHGAYMLLIMHYWISGPIRDHAKVLASITRLSSEDWEDCEPVIREFFSVDDGVWIHARIDKERGKAQHNRDQAQAAARARWSKRGVADDANEILIECGNDASAYPNAYPNALQTDMRNACTSPSPSPIMSLGTSNSLENRTSLGGQSDNPIEPTPSDDVVEFISVWNSTQGSRAIRKLTDARTASLRRRLKERDWDWRAALAKFPLEVTKSGTWRPDLDWFLRPDSVTKILEGKYDFTPRNAHASIPAQGLGRVYDEDRVAEMVAQAERNQLPEEQERRYREGMARKAEQEERQRRKKEKELASTNQNPTGANGAAAGHRTVDRADAP